MYENIVKIRKFLVVSTGIFFVSFLIGLVQWMTGHSHKDYFLERLAPLNKANQVAKNQEPTIIYKTRYKIRYKPVYLTFDNFKTLVKNEYPTFLMRLDEKFLKELYYIYVPRLMNQVNETRIKYGLKPLDFKYFCIFILEWMFKESSFNPLAKSKSGALGLTQVKLKTWKKKFPELTRWKLLRPDKNLEYGIKILVHYLKMSRGYLFMALSRYNTGIKNPALGKEYASIIMKRTRERVSK